MVFPSDAASKMAALDRSQALIGFRWDSAILTAKTVTSTGRRSDATWHFRDELRAGRSHVAAFRQIPCVRAASIDPA